MKCLKCRCNLPESANFCPTCGAKVSARKPKIRGNGAGTVFKRGRTWTAMVTIGYSLDDSGNMHRKTRSRGGFSKKQDALDYLPHLRNEPEKRDLTLKQLYEKWYPTHRAGPSTMECYSAAWKYFESVADSKLSVIEIDDLQACLDDCPHGKRTRQNMKALCGLLYKYAIPRSLATLNLGQYLTVTAEDNPERQGLPLEALTILWQNVDTVPYADYILCQCYLGFRPSEFLALDARDYDRRERAFTGGAKTDAGRNRVVTVSPKIQPIVDRLTGSKLSGPVFCASDGSRMAISTYRSIFYRVLESCDIANPDVNAGGTTKKMYTPHSCRHTFATLIKAVSAPDEDKLRLIGHTSTEMLRHYQDVDVKDLRRITDAI